MDKNTLLLAHALVDLEFLHDAGAGRCTYTHHTITCPCCFESVECNWKDVYTYETNFVHAPNCAKVLAQNIINSQDLNNEPQ
jgi:hypothetical protein